VLFNVLVQMMTNVIYLSSNDAQLA